MEGRGGARLVTAVRSRKSDRAFVGERAVGVRLTDVLGRDLRFEASAYALDARHAVAELRESGHKMLPLYGESGLAKHAHNAFRFRRIFVDPEHGVPFLSSSDIIELSPERSAFLSRKIQARLNDLLISQWQVLLSCSGTIGNVALASPRIAGWALSQDAIRITCQSPFLAGYATAFLRSRWGRVQVQGATYGSVVQHIEPHHLEAILIPVLPEQEEIGKAFVDAARRRDEANALFDRARERLVEMLDLPPPTIESGGPLIGCVRQRALGNRFDAWYHSPTVRWIEKRLAALKIPIKTIGDKEVSREVRAVTKFRKRVYVTEGGIPLLSSKQLFQIDPIEVKRLARGAHEHDLPEISLSTNMVVVTRSGTIGRVQIIPQYMNGWAGSEHVNRILAADDIAAGYLYAWLSSPLGNPLIKRFSYGSVILELDRFQLAKVPVPWVFAKERRVIAEMVLRANTFRDEAWQLEQAALGTLQTAIESKPKRQPLVS